jgi:hypothetical protein
MGSPNSLTVPNPQLNRLMGIGKGLFCGLSMGHTTGQFWHFGNKSIVFLAPIDDDFVLVH